MSKYAKYGNFIWDGVGIVFSVGAVGYITLISSPSFALFNICCFVLGMVVCKFIERLSIVLSIVIFMFTSLLSAGKLIPSTPSLVSREDGWACIVANGFCYALPFAAGSVFWLSLSGLRKSKSLK